MGGGARLKRTRQGLLTPGFNKMEGVFNPYMECNKIVTKRVA